MDELVERVVPGEGTVLLHAWPAVTAEGLGRVIAGLRDRGADFVTPAMQETSRARRAACRSSRPALSRGTAGGSPRPREGLRRLDLRHDRFLCRDCSSAFRPGRGSCCSASWKKIAERYCADVPALTVELRRVVLAPEDAEQLS